MRIATASGRTSTLANGMASLSRGFGIIGTTTGVGLAAYDITDAPPGLRGHIALYHGSALAGGSAGALGGGALGAGFGALVAGPVTGGGSWVVAGFALVGGLGFGYVGSEVGGGVGHGLATAMEE
jgi:hypothetical protein